MFKYTFYFMALVCYSTWLLAYNVGDRPASFKLMGHDGKFHTLKQYRGKFVVLEWYNSGCPYVRKHYDSGNMQQLQGEFTKKDVIWLSIVSSAKGKQGYFATSFKAYQMKIEEKSLATAVLIDKSGKVGRSFGAKTTPEMFILNKKGTVVYEGSIDNIASSSQADIKRARNYIRHSLDKLLKGENITLSKTKSYGCSIKY